MRCLRLASLLGLLLLLSFPLWAQIQGSKNPTSSSGGTSEELTTLQGRVLLAETLKPVARVAVNLLAQNGTVADTTFTNEHGEFRFRSASRGIYYVEVDEDGYEVARERVDAILEVRRDVVLLLKPKGETQPTNLPTEPAVSVAELKIPAEARAAFDAGMEKAHDKKLPESLKDFQQAIALYPDYADAYVQMGLVYLEMKQLSEAQAAVEKGIALNPDDVLGHLVHGNILQQQGQSEQAVQAFLRAVELDDTAWLGHLEVAKILLQLDRVEEAYVHANRARELHADVPSVHLLLYNLAVRQQDAEKAIAALEEFLSRYPDHPMAAQARQQKAALEAAQRDAKP